jgi:hypothetical protein
VALLLERRGIVRVRPLHGGIASWRDLKFPVIDLAVPAKPEQNPNGKTV